MKRIFFLGLVLSFSLSLQATESFLLTDKKQQDTLKTTTYSAGEGKYLLFKIQVKEGKKYGHATVAYKNGDIYEGDWLNGGRVGQGVLTYANGDRYEGNWKNDKRDGEGTMYYANGDRYEGDWKDDEQGGKGIVYYANGDRFEGTWILATLRKGKYFWKNGDWYEGWWGYGKRIETGVYHWKSGARLEGRYVDGKAEGEHYYFKAGEQTAAEVWVLKNGKLIETRDLRMAAKTTSTTPSQTKSNTINGHEYVDLGLPSGTLWATCNVGANKPEEYGDYFAWGETETNPIYDWSMCRYYNSETTVTKYCTDSSYGTVDNKTTLEASDDVARVNWGHPWRMPTATEQDELKKKCTWSWTSLNGVNGCVVKGPNGKTIFLPAAGYCDVTGIKFAGKYGHYWSSSLEESDPNYAHDLLFGSGYCARNGYKRYGGLSVRPVCSPR